MPIPGLQEDGDFQTMKILFINSLYPPKVRGGAEITVKTLAEALSARGHQVHVLTTLDQPGIIKEKQGGVNIIRAEVRNIHLGNDERKATTPKRFLWHLTDRYNVKMEELTREVISDLKPDVVSCHTLAGFSISAWNAAKETNVPIVQALHDLYLMCPKTSMFRKNRICARQCLDCRLLRWSHHRLSNQVTAVIGISEYVLQHHLSHQYFSRVKIRRVVYNAREPFRVAAGRNDEDGRRPRIFGFLGALSRHKGIEMLIDVFAALKVPGLKLLIGGKGDSHYEKYLKKKASLLNIDFLGFVRKEEFLGAIDVTIVPSMWDEPLGMVVAESLHAGVPVIASKRGGIPEIVTDGQNGLLFNPEKCDELKSAILRIAQEEGLYNKLENNARDSVRSLFDVERFAGEYEQVYREAIEAST